jgi:hypothetical protein
MVPLKLLRDGSIHDLSTDAFHQSIIDACNKHKEDSRALAFAFILYDFKNPEISKILNDRDYWAALNIISGEYLSIFYIHSRKNIFGLDQAKDAYCEKRFLYPIDGDDNLSGSLSMIKRSLDLDEEVKNPSILFFQVDGTLVCDYFIVELSEEKIEESFLELKDYISSAVTRLKMITPENYRNAQPIFFSLKQGVQSTKFRRILFKNIQKFPVPLLISWIVGKVKF